MMTETKLERVERVELSGYLNALIDEHKFANGIGLATEHTDLSLSSREKIVYGLSVIVRAFPTSVPDHIVVVHASDGKEYKLDCRDDAVALISFARAMPIDQVDKIKLERLIELLRKIVTADSGLRNKH